MMKSHEEKSNIHNATVSGFGDEWSRFDQSALTTEEHEKIFQSYFKIFPWEDLPENAQGFDLGCGSGRWATKVAPRVGKLHLIDPSPDALSVAKKNMAHIQNCEFHQASVDQIPLQNSSMDFGYSLGVLHHVPDTALGIKSCTEKLKPGAPFLIYLYYSFDNRPLWYRMIWQCSEIFRAIVSRLPHSLRYAASQIIASLVYWPIARVGLILSQLGINTKSFPLHYYQTTSFYTMRTDALDRFGTRLEQRFSRIEIKNMLAYAGLENIQFSEELPYWVAVGYKK